ncbi:MAG TPA: hypothetical protein VGL15_16770, partial [Vicinamibacteria bacterium]
MALLGKVGFFAVSAFLLLSQAAAWLAGPTGGLRQMARDTGLSYQLAVAVFLGLAWLLCRRVRLPRRILTV